MTFGELASSFSGAAQLASDRGRGQIIKKNWKKLLEPKEIRELVEEILQLE